jgi:uncharacterized protein Yka (UPF0111/DUF47 family)
MEVLIAICLIVVEIVMLHGLKKNNEIWWRTYWAKDKVMLDKVKEVEAKMDEIRRDIHGTL